MNFPMHLHLAHLADNSLSGNLLADFVQGNPETHYSPDVVVGIFVYHRIDVMIDNSSQVREAKKWSRGETRHVASIVLDAMWDHFLPHYWPEISPDSPLTDSVRYARTQVIIISPELLPRFINLNGYIWSEKWPERYRDMDFTQNTLNSMASHRPRPDALHDSWYDFNTHCDTLEKRFWQSYP